MKILNFGKSSGDSQAKGDRWKRWAEEDGLYQALDDIALAHFLAAKNLSVGDDVGLKMCIVAMKNVETLKRQIGIVIGNGKIDAAKSINKEKRGLK